MNKLLILIAIILILLTGFQLSIGKHKFVFEGILNIILRWLDKWQD